MEAQAWTAIGLLAATLFGVLFYLGNRIDSLSSEMRRQFEGLSSRSDALSARIDTLSARLDGRVDNLADRIYELALKLDDHLRRHAG